jgi:hypothetical protein
VAMYVTDQYAITMFLYLDLIPTGEIKGEVFQIISYTDNNKYSTFTKIN